MATTRMVGMRDAGTVVTVPLEVCSIDNYVSPVRVRWLATVE